MSNIEFQDNRIKCKNALEEAIISFLHESGGEIQSQAIRNQRRKSGKTAGSWDYIVNDDLLEAVVGNPLENAIWEEFGTGEYALKGNGRKGGWYYVDEDGKGHFTRGKKPCRALHNAFTELKPKIIKRAESEIKANMT